MNSQTIESIQAHLVELRLDGWLLVNHHGMDPVAAEVLGMPVGKKASRRWWYLIPRDGMPKRLVHSVEPDMLDGAPGGREEYASGESLRKALSAWFLAGPKLAMQYSPMAQLPMVSLVDAGTVELVRGLGANVVSSADLLQRQYATLDDAQMESHREASGSIYRIKDEAFAYVRDRVASREGLTDLALQSFVVQRFAECGLTCDGHPPIVGVNRNAANPHFAVNPDSPVFMRYGDRVLLDLWARLDRSRSVYADICWCANLGESPKARYSELFDAVVRARDSAVELVQARLGAGVPVSGAEVDQAARASLNASGVLEFSVHRTGHSIGTEVHGRGANIDCYETYDTRAIIPRTCFSVEPALYEGEIGVRSEIDVLIGADNVARVYGVKQTQLEVIELR